MDQETKEIIDCFKLDGTGVTYRISKSTTYEITKTTEESPSNIEEAVRNPGPSTSQSITVRPPKRLPSNIEETVRYPGPSTSQSLTVMPPKRRPQPEANASNAIKRPKTVESLTGKADVIVARVLWKTKQFAPHKKLLVLQVSLVDVDGEEIAAIAWEKRAAELYDTLQLHHVYEITGVKKKEKKWLEFSKLKGQKFQLNVTALSKFRDVTETTPFPQLKYSFRDFSAIGDDVCSVIGLVWASDVHGAKTITLIDAKAQVLRIDVSVSYEEIKSLDIRSRETILAILGIERKRATGSGSSSHPEAFTYQDTAFVFEPKCDETRIICEWIQSPSILEM